MSGKQKPSKKAVKEKQTKAIEDSTFGLKNKNKSKKVQQFIDRVEKQVKHSNGAGDAARAKELKKEAKLAKQLQEEEMRVLFNEAIANQFGVKKSKAQANAENLGLLSAKKEVSEFLEQLSSSESDTDSESDDDEHNAYTFHDSEPVAVEIFREKTIEDIIEEQRAKLAAEGKKGTPVTEESFAKWRADKLLRKQAEAEARVKAEQLKKKGGKGLSVLSGKELFSYNASLFVDDESAFDTSDDNKLSDELKEMELKEALRLEEETARAQAEQKRLMEAQLLEIEVRKHREEARRQAARAADRVTFVFNGIIINQIVFEEEDEEDLELFSDDEFARPVAPLTKATGVDQVGEQLAEKLTMTADVVA
eukprot:gene5083-5585_t